MNNNSVLLDKIGLGNADIGVIILILVMLLIISIIFIIITFIKARNLEKRLKIFMTGKDGNNLEQDIMTIHEENKYLKACADRNKKDIKILFKKAEKAFSKIGVVKYDAFQQMGGQLSFSLALLDENNDGFIINSVHSTDGCYSYTKVVKKGTCDLALGKEEEKALAIAINGEND